MTRYLFLITFLPTCALAHDYGCDGRPISPAIKAACCGKADFHRLRDDQIHEVDGGYIVVDAGHTFTIPRHDTQPAPDGCPAIFYKPDASNPTVYCFFMPMEM